MNKVLKAGAVLMGLKVHVVQTVRAGHVVYLRRSVPVAGKRSRPLPYISEHLREDLDFYPDPISVGELNFVITSMILKFLGPEPRYADFNDVIGVLECAKLELYRRSLSNYEDHAAFTNGDLDYPYKRNID